MKKIHIIMLSAAMLLSLGASAQSFRSGYFLDNYVYGYRINPAQVNDRGFFALLLGNMDFQNRTTFGVSQFLYPASNGLVTGLNSLVTPDEFLGKFKANNYLALDESINILALGVAIGRPMHTLEVNVRVGATASLPYDLFAIVKSGKAGTYDLGGIYLDATALADVCYGFSTHIGDHFSAGARLHFLYGAANGNLTGNQSYITLSDKQVAALANMDLNVSGIFNGGLNPDGSFGFDNININPWPPTSYGGAVDLGFQYTSDFGMEAMVSVTDLGMMSWANQISAHAEASIDYTGGSFTFENGTINTNFEEIMQKFTDSLVEPKFTTGTRAWRMMPWNAAAGVRYHMPFWKGLSVGALGTYHFEKCASWYDARLGVTVTPARIITATTNIGYSTFGPTWGGAIDLHLGPFNLLAGFDGYIGPMGKFGLGDTLSSLNGVPVVSTLSKAVTFVPFPLNGSIGNAHIGLTLTF